MRKLRFVGIAIAAAFAIISIHTIPPALKYDFPMWELYRAASRIRAPIPVNEPPKGVDFYWQALRVQAILQGSLGYTLQYVDAMPFWAAGAAGLSNFETHQIYIMKDVEWNGRLEVLAHEGGHLLQPDVKMEYAEREVFAEAVSYLVCRRLGADVTPSAAIYMKYYMTGWHVTEEFRQEIDWAADVLIGPQ